MLFITKASKKKSLDRVGVGIAAENSLKTFVSKNCYLQTNLWKAPLFGWRVCSSGDEYRQSEVTDMQGRCEGDLLRSRVQRVEDTQLAAYGADWRQSIWSSLEIGLCIDADN